MPTYKNNTSKRITGKMYDNGVTRIFNIESGQSKEFLHYLSDADTLGLTKIADTPYWNPMSTAPVTASLTAAGSTVNITAITKAINAQVSATAHGLATGDYCYISTAVGGMVEIRDRIAKITKVSNDVFTCDNIDSRTFTTFTSGGTVRKVTPLLVAVHSSTDKIKVYGLSQYTSAVRVHGQSALNHPNLGDVIDQYDLILDGVMGRWQYLSLTEIAGVASTTVRIEQRV